jgi:hypothetical protein
MSDAVTKQGVIDQPAAVDTSRHAKEQSKVAKELAGGNVDGKLIMQVKVYSPFRDYYDGQAFSVSAVNDTGPFDILPRHHNFISLLNQCEITIRDVRGDERKILISGGIMHVKADRVIVFLDV